MINLPQGHTEQPLTTHKIYSAQQRHYTISLPKVSINILEGGGGSVCHPNKQEYPHVFVVHTDLSLAQVDKCTHMCPDANTHRDVNVYRARSMETLFSQQQSLEMQLESHWLIRKKCS